MQRLLLTGAAGQVATMLRPRLASPGRVVRLLDLKPVQPSEGEELASHLDEAMENVDAVIHLGGQSRENTIENVLDSNVLGTYHLFEAARKAGVGRVVLASSAHAAGFASRPADGSMLPADTPARPDTLYGLSKVAMESCGRLYADRYGMDVICLRIGSWSENADQPRALAMWLSNPDGARLIEACLRTPDPGFRIVWGISRNTRRYCSLAEGEAIGYYPEDDAEQHIGHLSEDASVSRAGGTWCDIPLGVPL